jgi:hypothetical protein
MVLFEKFSLILNILFVARSFDALENVKSLNPGLNPTINKNTEKSCFLYSQEISYRQIFLVKQKNFLRRFFGAAS